jgi:hypothetical protein
VERLFGQAINAPDYLWVPICLGMTAIEQSSASSTPGDGPASPPTWCSTNAEYLTPDTGARSLQGISFTNAERFKNAPSPGSGHQT